MTYANMHLYGLDRRARNDVLDQMLRFYSLHHTRLDGLHSLEILRAL